MTKTPTIHISNENEVAMNAETKLILEYIYRIIKNLNEMERLLERHNIEVHR